MVLVRLILGNLLEYSDVVLVTVKKIYIRTKIRLHL